LSFTHPHVAQTWLHNTFSKSQWRPKHDTIDFHCMHKKILRHIPKYFCSSENDLTRQFLEQHEGE